MTAFVQKNLAAISSVGGGGGGGEGSGDASVNPGAPVQIPNFENSNFPLTSIKFILKILSTARKRT